jgi:hypothetical protein
MNRKVLSTSLSLACHTIFLIIAFNVFFTPSSVSAPISPPVLIHVHIDSRPFSPSMGNAGLKIPQKTMVKAPEMRMAPKKKPQFQKKQSHPVQTRVMNKPVPARKKNIPKDNVLAIPKTHAPAFHAPARRETNKTIFNTMDVFKDMKVANRKMAASSIMPVSDISDQIQQMPMTPSLESELPDYQGATPYLPFEQNGTGTDIKAFLGYTLDTYEDPADNVKYFKLSIQVEEIPGTLPPLAKEITFIIDASNSIGPELLAQFGSGVGKCLRLLGGNDKFNIIVFNDQVRKMQEEAVANTVDNIQQGEEFVSDLKPRSTTDLYETVQQSINVNHAMRPSYLYLLSDGQPTEGVTDPVQIIDQIGHINKGRVPIFGLGAGFPNKYFMSFLSFTNHGWAEFGPSIAAEDSVIQLYNHIKDPVLTNLRYQSVGLDKNEIYPKLLPDLFKGSEFVLYGRYTTEGDFMFQLRGDSQNDLKQYVIKDNLANGRTGDRTIAEEWAMRKIYDLLGQLKFDQSNQDIIEEVNALAMKFNLKIPPYKSN